MHHINVVSWNTVIAGFVQHVVSWNDQHIPLQEDGVGDETEKNIYGNDKQLANQVRVDHEKECMPAEKCNGNTEVLIERKKVLVEVLQSKQLEIDYDYHKLGDECDGNGQILLEKREELVKVVMVDKIRADGNLYKGEEESDHDVEVTIEKCEEFLGDVAANGIQLSKKLESSIMYGDQDIICSDVTEIHRHESGICDVIKKTYLLLPIIDSLSLLKPVDHDHVANLLIIENMKILEGGGANETEDSINVEDWGLTYLVKANDENKNYRKITHDKLEGADEIGVENDQQMQCEGYQKNHNEDQKYSSNKSSPEINSFQSNGCEEQDFSFPLLESLPKINL